MKPIYTVLTVLILIGASGCKKYSGEKAEADRQEWIRSIHDSIQTISSRRQSDSIRLATLLTDINDNIMRFTRVSNPREVEPYYILTSFKGAYPLSSTGVAARMTDSEQLELIAAHSGGAFDAIRVTSGGVSAETESVPRDQALNYTSGGLTTVAFTGAKADSVCALVSDHATETVTLEYLLSGRRIGSISLSEPQKEWLAGTWSVCGAHIEARHLEQSMLLDSRKIQILHLTLNRETEKASSSEETK